jgi:hypothetical protein
MRCDDERDVIREFNVINLGLALKDSDSGLEIWVPDFGDKSPGEPASKSLFDAWKLCWKLVAGKNNLFVCVM